MSNSIPVNFSSVPDYVISHANSSISKTGEPLKQGQRKTRLRLSNDSRFWVAVKVIDQNSGLLTRLGAYIGKLAGRYVAIQKENKSLYVNVNSIAKRLHIQKAKIQEAAEAGTLSLPLLAQRAEQAQSTVTSYEKIIKHFGEKSKTGLSPQTLMKVIRTTIKREQPIYTPLTIQTHTYYIGFDKNKKEIELITKDKLLGSGAYGAVYALTSLFHKPNEEIFKQAHTKPNIAKSAKKDVENEYRKLKYIHQNGQIWGIQAAPRQIVQITEGQGVAYGYIGTRYTEDYWKEARKTNSLEARLIDFHQLLSGLSHLSKLHILHGDIKPENILVKEDQAGTKLVHIADFGGTRIIDDSIPTSQLKPETYTPPYGVEEEYLSAKKLADMGKRDEFIELEKKRDVFAMGYTLYFALSGGLDPFSIFKVKGAWHANLHTYKPLSPTVPLPLSNLIKKMLDPNPKNRPTPEEAFEIYETFLKQTYPILYNQIQTKIKSEYPGTLTSS